MTFGQKLAELRTASGMTQDELATASGVPAWTLRKYEQGVTVKVPFPSVVAMAKALGTDCTVFADCEDVTETEPAEAEAPPPVKKPKSKGKGK